MIDLTHYFTELDGEIVPVEYQDSSVTIRWASTLSRISFGDCTPEEDTIVFDPPLDTAESVAEQHLSRSAAAIAGFTTNSNPSETMADFVQGLDPGKLVLSGAVLSFIISPFSAPAYNLPIFLFGALVHESNDAVQSLKLFSGILTGSILFDIIWVFNNEHSGFVKILLFLLWLLKFPTVAIFLAVLRQRGSHFMSLGPDINGPTVWSMPGGFTSSGREGYQVVDDEPRVSAPRGPPAPQKTPIAAPVPQLAPGVQPSNYQNA